MPQNVGWFGVEHRAKSALPTYERDYPGMKFKIVPRKGAKHTVNAKRNGYEIVMSKGTRITSKTPRLK